QVAGTGAAAAHKGSGVVEKTADALQRAADTTAQAAQRTAGTATRAASKATDRTAEVVEKAATTTAGTVEKAADKAADASGKVTEGAATAVDKAADTTTSAAAVVTEQAAGVAGSAASTTAADEAGTVASRVTTPPVPEAEAPKGSATPKATGPDATRVETAATADVVDTVERVASVIGGEVLDHDDLPLPDYDHLTLGAVRGRMRSLDLPQLVQLRDYEKAKANRLPVVTMLDNRIAKLASDPTAPLSGGDGGAGASPKAASPTSPGKGPRTSTSKISPATASPEANAPRTAFGGLGGSVPDKG
ncbi:MAG: hypothetical protein JWN08_2763, partial [Frankiales bacterium]|nr:hypothetical protein [Frankiales bacterium]